MRIELDVPDYSPEEGLRFDWDEDFMIEVHSRNDEVVITANRAGLVSLARHLLELAQVEVPPGSHFHLDDSTGLEENSCSLVVAQAQ